MPSLRARVFYSARKTIPPSSFAMHLFRSTLVIVLPNGGPASSASILHSADNVLFSKLKLLHCPSGRMIGGEIGSLGEAKPRSKPSRLMSGRTTRGEIGVEEATGLRQLKRRNAKLKKDM
jgi:hypothetical protein